MPKVNVEASIEIAASRERVHEVLVDFNTWPIWSPWLYLEPDARLEYRGEVGQTGHGYDWVGRKTGAGGMTLLHSSLERIDCDLQFLKPYKSEAEVAFDLEAVDASTTRLTWHMKSSLPFFMFWMKATMVGMITSDYHRGLALLKDYLETGSTHSSTKIDGIVDVEALYYVGAKGAGFIRELGPSMEESFKTLTDTSTARQYSISGLPFVLYNSMDIKTGHCDYTAALPTFDPTPVESPLVSALRPECRALKVIHAGPYKHLGNAWSLIMAEAREQKLKINKSLPPFERYLNDPDEVDEDDLITEIYLPLKAS